jgi:uncharacterized membrane protein
MKLPNPNTIFFTLSAPFFKNSKGQEAFGKKIMTFIMIFVGIVFLSIILTRVVPLLPIPISFYPWFLFFLLCVLFFFFYAAYKSI